VYENFSRVPADSVEAGDICAVCGISDIMVSIIKYFFINKPQSYLVNYCLISYTGNFIVIQRVRFNFICYADW